MRTWCAKQQYNSRCTIKARRLKYSGYCLFLGNGKWTAHGIICHNISLSFFAWLRHEFSKTALCSLEASIFHHLNFNVSFAQAMLLYCLTKGKYFLWDLNVFAIVFAVFLHFSINLRTLWKLQFAFNVYEAHKDKILKKKSSLYPQNLFKKIHSLSHKEIIASV